MIEARRKELLQLEKQLKFPKKVKLFPLYSASRWLVKRGDAKRIFWNDKNNPDGKSPTKLIKKFGWKDGTRKEKYHLLLFNDILGIRNMPLKNRTSSHYKIPVIFTLQN